MQASQPGDRVPAPGKLGLVQDFINSNDREGGDDLFDTSAGLLAWSSEHGLANVAALGAPDLERATNLREALRLLARKNRDPAVNDSPAWALVNRELRRAHLRLELGPSAVRLVPQGGGVDRLLGEVLAAMTAAIGDGSWQRLKACRRDGCQWVFYDHSRNQAATWCAMQICGAREKAKAYYRRRAPAQRPIHSDAAIRGRSVTQAAGGGL
jgi:predicted RNA-binding Zn ribbon-like protein